MIVVTPAVPEDETTLVDLLAAQLEEHAIDTPRAEITGAVRGLLADARRGFMLLARDGERPVGVAFVSFTWSLEHGGLTSWLEELYVVPDRRSGGIGGALLEAAVAQARAAGCAAVDLEVTEEHARAARLYLREGFRPLGRTRYVRKL